MVFTVPKPFLIQPPVQRKFILYIKCCNSYFSCIKYLPLVKTIGSDWRLLSPREDKNAMGFIRFMWKNVKLISSFIWVVVFPSNLGNGKICFWLWDKRGCKCSPDPCDPSWASRMEGPGEQSLPTGSIEPLGHINLIKSLSGVLISQSQTEDKCSSFRGFTIFMNLTLQRQS